MKRFILLLMLLNFSYAFAGSSELSKQATAFYSDNNHVRTMDLLLQIKETDRSAQDWLLLGNVMADNGKIDDAIYMYKKSIEKSKKSYKAYYNIGNYYYGRGDYDTALEYYTKASRIKSENPYIYYNIGCAYLKKNSLAKARTNFNKAILYNSSIPEFHYNLAYVYKLQNREKSAQIYLDNYNKLISNQ